jgi:hypothetical protein
MGSMVVRQMGAMGAEMLIRRAEMDYPAGEQKDARIVDELWAKVGDGMKG